MHWQVTPPADHAHVLMSEIGMKAAQAARALSPNRAVSHSHSPTAGIAWWRSVLLHHADPEGSCLSAAREAVPPAARLR